MPLLTRSGRRRNPPPPADHARTRSSKASVPTESDADDDADDDQVMCHLLYALESLLITTGLSTSQG